MLLLHAAVRSTSVRHTSIPSHPDDVPFCELGLLNQQVAEIVSLHERVRVLSGSKADGIPQVYIPFCRECEHASDEVDQIFEPSSALPEKLIDLCVRLTRQLGDIILVRYEEHQKACTPGN